MNLTRIIVVASAIFIGFLQLLLMLHHVIKIRLGDIQEGWNVGFVIHFLSTLLLMAVLIEIARKIKDQRDPSNN